MNTVLYDYQEKIATDIYKRIIDDEIRGAYLRFRDSVQEKQSRLCL